MDPSLRSPPFTQRVVKAMRALYPEELADRAWDNVGLLQENIAPAEGSVPARVLLTNDLTLRVAEEAIQKKASVIISYHPFIFRGLKSITLNDPHQRIVLRLAQHNIAVYSPHTAADAVLGGVNDWLVDILKSAMYSNVPNVNTTVTVVQPAKGPAPAGFEGAGYGRLVRLGTDTELDTILKTYAARLGMRHVLLARPRGGSQRDISSKIRTVAICAGSGADVLQSVTDQADLIITGEMSHHAALRLTMLGKYVLTVFHSNSERGFLREVLQPQLLGVLEKEEKGVEVVVSEEDEDPFEIWGPE
ncbi:GTP cyclohydrolase 1 type 2/Nif3 [Dichotomopilus funicola]|uniref:GTP cyclohydrolase 1 type 2/Nif3 n=1 Tax=Dichotomopilus funicola TaxID=1934379 RepID=A0AAN6V1D2_9PEZI|nr:GTP cyclohydrolase 1 type 2/Nif3 [Dichotomopilus funicola]